MRYGHGLLNYASTSDIFMRCRAVTGRHRNRRNDYRYGPGAATLIRVRSTDVDTIVRGVFIPTHRGTHVITAGADKNHLT